MLQSDGFDPATANHAFTIAMIDYAALVLLPPLLVRLRVEAPRVDVRNVEWSVGETAELLDSGEATTAGCTAAPTGGFV